MRSGKIENTPLIECIIVTKFRTNQRRTSGNLELQISGHFYISTHVNSALLSAITAPKKVLFSGLLVPINIITVI